MFLLQLESKNKALRAYVVDYIDVENCHLKDAELKDTCQVFAGIYVSGVKTELVNETVHLNPKNDSVFCSIKIKDNEKTIYSTGRFSEKKAKLLKEVDYDR